MSERPNAGLVLIGMFVILFGSCMALVGGGCTLMMLVSAGQMSGGSDFTFFLLISLVVLAVGGALVWLGIKLVRSANRS